LAVAFKRVRNIACELPDAEFELAERDDPDLRNLLNEDAELHLLQELEQRGPIISNVITVGKDYRTGFAEAARFGPVVDQFFSEVFVMVEDVALRRARLRLVKRLERLILKLADISEVVPGDDT
jgi:glycyl-tRNA synthetase beta subunit